MKIKGSVLNELYPEEYIRFQADVDILLEDIKELWKVMQRLEKEYRYERVKMYCGQGENKSFSIDMIPMNRKLYRYIDIHLNPYYIWGGIFLKGDIFKESKMEGRVCCPSIEDQVVMLVAHTANQWRYRMRDVNDLYLIVKNKRVNWTVVRDKIKKNNLESIFKIYMYMIGRMYGFNFCIYGKEELNWVEKMFCNHNFGNESVLGSFFIELIYSYKIYEGEEYRFPLLESLKNTFCMIFFKNRAFWVNKNRKIKRIKANKIIVFTKQKFLSQPKGTAKMYGDDIVIYNEGRKDEIVYTPVGMFKQDAYHAKGKM